jgi:hypothetical protein
MLLDYSKPSSNTNSTPVNKCEQLFAERGKFHYTRSVQQVVVAFHNNTNVQKANDGTAFVFVFENQLGLLHSIFISTVIQRFLPPVNGTLNSSGLSSTKNSGILRSSYIN